MEKNVSLVKFENGRIEISFNDNLDKSFVKRLISKTFLNGQKKDGLLLLVRLTWRCNLLKKKKEKKKN